MCGKILKKRKREKKIGKREQTMKSIHSHPIKPQYFHPRFFTLTTNAIYQTVGSEKGTTSEIAMATSV